jgi:hypothetical protein
MVKTSGFQKWHVLINAHPEMNDSGWSRQPSAFSYQQKHRDPIQLADGLSAGFVAD